jgi:4-hydroxybenzoate polyprenyltransferase
MNMIRNLLISLRPEQWYKNLVIFIGIIFSMKLLETQLWLNALSAFAIFCMLSGSSYIVNDVFDAEKDRGHPKKSKRPIASGKLKTGYALVFSVIIIVLTLLWSLNINQQFFLTTVVFVLINLTYSLWLKHIAIVDVLLISINFVIRATAGCLAVFVSISPWITLCALLLALLLALGKRRHEITLLGKNSRNHRKTLERYPKEMLEQMMSITAGSLIVSYSIFTFFSRSAYMMVTIPIVIYAIFRYLFLVHYKSIGGEPELIFKDRGMIISIIIWVILCIYILYDIQMFAGMMI